MFCGSPAGQGEEAPAKPSLQARTSNSLVCTPKHAHAWLQRWTAWRRWSGNWRNTMRMGTVVCVVVTILNLAILCWGWKRSLDPETGEPILAQGDCGQMQNISTYWHLAINVFSTLLLATSNSAMQCLSAPTRETVDRAHAKGDWVDIGISGLRNWKYMALWCKWCWVVLIVSSLPLHLLYNSAVFLSGSATEYWAVAVTSDFLTGAPYDIPYQAAFAASDPMYGQPRPSNATIARLAKLAASNSLQRLDRAECISNYSQTLQSSLSNVLLVAKDEQSNSSVLRWYHHFPIVDPSHIGNVIYGPSWICGLPDQSPSCDLQYFRDNASAWNLTALTGPDPDEWSGVEKAVWAPPIDVDYCLAEPVQSICSVQMVPVIMLVVVITNLAKIICLTFTLRKRSFNPLVTLGDAMASFLDRPDPFTTHLGPLSAAEIRIAVDRARQRSKIADPETPRMQRPDPVRGLPLELGPWKGTRRRWFSGASKLRWILTYFFLFLFSVVPVTVFAAYVSSPGDSFQSQWSAGFGNVSPGSVVISGSVLSVPAAIVCANIPQVALSLVYLSLNGLWTCILLSREFTQYAKRRAGLRVSSPRGQHQRSTFWLSLPYRFSLPLMALSWGMHWSISQSLFLADIKVISADDTSRLAYTVSTLGYSTLGMMILVILLGITVTTTASLGWMRYYTGAPLVESYSLAISAACHPLPGKDAAAQLLKYGEVEDPPQSQPLEETDRVNEPPKTSVSSTTFQIPRKPVTTEAPHVRRRLVTVALSSASVSALTPPNTYTPIRTLSEEELDPHLTKRVHITTFGRVLAWILPALWICKMILILFIMTMCTVLSPTGPGLPEMIVFSSGAIMYLLLRLVVGLVWIRMKTELQHWWWRVGLELFWSFAWVMALTRVFILQDFDLNAILLPVCLGVSSLFLIAGAMEWWLWRTGRLSWTEQLSAFYRKLRRA